MLVVKYKKTGSACYVSHVDTLRTINRTFSRADLDVDYSEGFNPHMLVFFSPPNAVGVQSDCEYFAVSTKDADDFINRFNKNAPHGFEAQKIWIADRNPNFAKEITKAEYIIKCRDIGKINIDSILKGDSFEVEFKDKNGVKKKNYRDFIFDIVVLGDDEIKATLKFGNENLRPDRFVDGLVQNYGLKKTECQFFKTKVFANNIDADQFMDNFVK